MCHWVKVACNNLFNSLFRCKNPFDFRRLFETPYVPPPPSTKLSRNLEEEGAEESNADSDKWDSDDTDDSDESEELSESIVVLTEEEAELTPKKRTTRKRNAKKELPPAKKGKGPAKGKGPGKAKNSSKATAASASRPGTPPPAEQAQSIMAAMQKFLGSMVSASGSPNTVPAAPSGSKRGLVMPLGPFDESRRGSYAGSVRHSKATAAATSKAGSVAASKTHSKAASHSASKASRSSYPSSLKPKKGDNAPAVGPPNPFSGKFCAPCSQATYLLFFFHRICS